MKMKYFRRGIKRSMRVIIAAVFLSVAVVYSHVNALENTRHSGSNAIKVSPLRTDISASPGETAAVDITITNPTKTSITVNLSRVDFVAGDEAGTPAPMLNNGEAASRHSLKQFMDAPESAVILPVSSTVITVTVRVPVSAHPGGYFGALRIAPVTANDGGQVGLNASIVSLILLSVKGNATEKLVLADFGVRQYGRNGSVFVGGDSLESYVRFTNNGDRQLGPIGKISVTKDEQIIYEADFNNKQPRDMVLPDSTRRWVIPIKKPDNIGRYTVNATFTYGSKNQTISTKVSFWVISPQVVIGVVAVIVLLPGIAIFALRRRRKIYPHDHR